MAERKDQTVLCTAALYYAGKSPSRIYSRVAEVADLRLTDAEAEGDLIPALEGVDAVIMRKGRFTRKVFAAAARLRGVVKWGVGVDSIDIPGATAEGVIIANSPGNAVAVAEASFLLLLAVSKNFLTMVDHLRQGKWQPGFDVRGRELCGKTLGIVGLGRIGRHLARLAQGAGMVVVACDPYAEEPGDSGVRMLGLSELLKTADAVSINATLTEETTHLIGEKELALMKPTAWLLNTARGPIVDGAALIRALEAGGIAGAGLDVFEEEPLPPDSPLLSMPNVVCTPHALARTRESSVRTVSMIQDATLAVLEGRLPETCLNRSVRPRFAQREVDR